MMENVGDAVSGMPYADQASSAAEDMDAFDHLPKMIRKVVSRFPAAIESTELLKAYESGSMSAIEIIHALRELEQQFYANAYADRGVMHG